MSNPQEYPRDGEQYGYYPKENTTYDLQEMAKRAQITAMPGLLEDVIRWFDGQISECDNIFGIEITEMTINGVKYSRKVSIEAQVLALQLLKEKLEAKKAELSAFVEENHDTEP